MIDYNSNSKYFLLSIKRKTQSLSSLKNMPIRDNKYNMYDLAYINTSNFRLSVYGYKKDTRIYRKRDYKTLHNKSYDVNRFGLFKRIYYS